MEFSAKGLRVLVTAGAAGIGRVMARTFSEHGAKVHICDVDEKALASTKKQLPAVTQSVADVSRLDDVDRLFADVKKFLGGLDVLVNNAGIAGPTAKVEDIRPEDWDRCIAIDLNGMFYCTRKAMPLIKRSGGGSIINLSSIYGLVGAPDVPPYHASKGAVRLMSKTDALLYAADGIRVNSIHPGFIWTPMVEQFVTAMGGDPAQHRREVGALHPLGHMGEPDDIAWAVVYLASDESRFVTGSELVVDGGYTCR
jgi:NAD(P)-dependent dehydrogenase (short-subunit alcohol dehydrogenase family)